MMSCKLLMYGRGQLYAPVPTLACVGGCLAPALGASNRRGPARQTSVRALHLEPYVPVGRTTPEHILRGPARGLRRDFQKRGPGSMTCRQRTRPLSRRDWSGMPPVEVHCDCCSKPHDELGLLALRLLPFLTVSGSFIICILPGIHHGLTNVLRREESIELALRD